MPYLNQQFYFQNPRSIGSDFPMSWTLFHAKLHQTLKERQLLPPESRILIALSGGQDSLCLAKLSLDLQPKWKWQLAIAHCDHGWLSDVGLATHVAKIAENWGIPFYLKTAQSQLPETEAAARAWRYQALTEIAQTEGFELIVTGHTMSDRAETLLYNLVRGAGSDGLSALSWQRWLTNHIQLIRPLLNFARQETLNFCQQFQLPIWEDSYNIERRYARNRLRADLIPYLQTQFNPQVEAQLAQTAELLQTEVEYLAQTARQIFQQAITENQGGLNRLVLRNVHLAIQRRVIRQFLAVNLKISANFREIEAVTNLINAPNKSRTPTLTRGAIAEVQGDLIILIKSEN
jgi:tRNA(Ile)-lysidine synthase